MARTGFRRPMLCQGVLDAKKVGPTSGTIRRYLSTIRRNRAQPEKVYLLEISNTVFVAFESLGNVFCSAVWTSSVVNLYAWLLDFTRRLPWWMARRRLATVTFQPGSVSWSARSRILGCLYPAIAAQTQERRARVEALRRKLSNVAAPEGPHTEDPGPLSLV